MTSITIYFELFAVLSYNLNIHREINWYSTALAVSLIFGTPWAGVLAFGPDELDEPGGGPIRMILEKMGVI
jgi:hypothetical protein